MGGKLAGLLLLVFLWGCMTVGREFPVTPIKSIQQNVTTQRDIFGYFGEPYRRGLDSGYETWTYSFHYYELGQLRDSKELYVVFNKDGTVRSYSFTTK
ncbi:MAG: outer membrane protein assembly factor BamE [Deltaproteobacteria bacterium]|nr:outer membrane protein assembly factor BamE [Deltaproteobacteria bacterium]